jgi:O-antigen/teichoic acid export membrane protein
MAAEIRRRGRPPEEDVDAGVAPANLAAVLVSGVLWKALTRGVSGLTRVVLIVVLARLLTPADYGVAQMALVVTAFVGMFSDPALSTALIQRPVIDERDRSTVFWIAIGIGVLLTAIGIATSGLVADFFGEEEVRALFVVTSLSFFLISLSVVHRALLVRRLAYRSLEVRDMVSIVVGGAVAVAVALAGYGPWAIVSSHVVSVLTSTVLLWSILRWRPRATFSIESARNLAGFSTRMFAAGLLSWSTHNLDKVLVGRALGPSPLGTYALAVTTMRLPESFVGRPFQQVLAPALSRIQSEPARLERAWLLSKRVSVAVVAPALLALLVVAPDFIDMVFGDRWDDAVVPLQILCLAGVAHSLASLHWSVLQARGKAGTLLRVTALSAAVTWTGFIVGLQWGIVGVAASYAIARWLLVVPITLMMSRAVAFNFWAALRAGTAMLPLAVAAAAVTFGSRQALLATGVPTAVRFALVVAVMVIVYGLLVRWVAPTLIADVVAIVRQWRLQGANRGREDPGGGSASSNVD